MRIINTYDKVQNCFSKNIFDINAWRKYADEISPLLKDKCEKNAAKYDFHNDVLPILNKVAEQKCKVAKANASFLSVTSNLQSNICKIFKDDIELDIILYLGLCNGAGWATLLDVRNVILLGIEKIVELDWQDEKSMQNLIFHEIGHIWHQTYGELNPPTFLKGKKSLVQLYQEGIAMVCEQILCQDSNFYHQNQNGWLDWCIANASDIKIEFLKRIRCNESTQDFFGDWCNYKGHSDVGYFLGCEFIKYLQESYSLIEIANMSIRKLYKNFKHFALQ